VPRRDLRDSLWGKALILGVLLVLAAVVARTCGSQDTSVSQDEAVQIATENADFVPCEESGCVVVRALNQGIPVRLVWVVGLAERLGPDGKPLRHANFEIDAATGEITRRP
jgi:hypothetical protein